MGENMSEYMQPPYLPIETSKALQVFPGDVMHLMPAPEDIPKDLPQHWLQFQRDWFFHGLSEGAEFYPQEGIDAKVAFEHLSCIQKSYQPKHEHKQAAVAYLASLWFTEASHWKE